MSIEKPDYSKEGIRKSALEAIIKISERSDELPKKRLTLEDPKSNYKCTNNCFAMVAFWLDHLIDKEIITNTEIVEKLQKFIEYAQNKSNSKELTTKEEIQYINDILNFSIQYLEELRGKI